MLEKVKSYIELKHVNKYIDKGNYDLALETLNSLVKDDFNPSETYLKRGMLCHKLLMLEDAYSDFTYIITHCVDKEKAYYERMKLNYELSNFAGVIADANIFLHSNPDNTECQRYRFLALVFNSQKECASNYVMQISGNDKYRAIQYILKETANCVAYDELAKGLKLLEVIDIIDSDNPMKIFQQANIYGLAGEKEKEKHFLNLLESAFPKYFISHFRFTDMFEERNLLEISFLLELKIFDKYNNFAYPMYILEGYKNQMEGHIINSKEAFENAIKVNAEKPEAYVLLGQTLQLMSGYDNPAYKSDAEKNYRKAIELYEKDKLILKAEYLKKQIKHLNSSITL